MNATATTSQPGVTSRTGSAGAALAAAVLGFFVVTLDAVIVNVALPSVRDTLGGGIAGLQWVVDGYTLLFAALLLSGGSLADRVGARRALVIGIAAFAVASLGCGLAPTLPTLVVARLVQGGAAALIMPASLTLVSDAYPDPTRRGRAVALWAMGGSVASTCGPVAGGLLTVVDWRLIFLVNVPVAALALAALRQAPASITRPARFDRVGQPTVVVAMAAVTYAAIESGDAGVTSPQVVLATVVAVAGIGAFIVSQARVEHPMLPLELFGGRVFRVCLAAGFAFMVGYFGLPFLMSLFFQQTQGMSALQAGVAFLPMMVIGLVLTPFSARIVERFGARAPIAAGFAAMTVGMVVLSLTVGHEPVWVLSLLMVLVGLGGPLTMPPATAILLHHVPIGRTGAASGAFNTSRQVGGALSVAVFGALLANSARFTDGLVVSLLLAALVLLATTLACLRLPRR